MTSFMDDRFLSFSCCIFPIMYTSESNHWWCYTLYTCTYEKWLRQQEHFLSISDLILLRLLDRSPGEVKIV